MPSHLETVFLKPSSDMVDLVKSVPSPDVCIRNCSMEQLAQEKIQSDLKSNSEQEAAFFIGDLGEIFRQHVRWKVSLCRIEPFFAVKCNPDPMVLGLLASLGLGFDCSSKSEIQQILDAGVEPHRILQTNPCKQASLVRFALQQNVSRFICDTIKELSTIKKLYPDAEVILRIILPNNPNSLCQLGLKSGASLEDVKVLIDTAKELELNLVGVSFSIDSLDLSLLGDAFKCIKVIFNQAENNGFNMSLLYLQGIGGKMIPFEKVASVLSPIIDNLFSSEIRVIAETGEHYVASAFAMCATVIGRRTAMSLGKKQQWAYHINDGMYGAFKSRILGQRIAQPKVLVKDEVFTLGQHMSTAEHVDSSVWGPTCDPMDCLNVSVQLPLLEPGDWLYYDNMGAYTICAASQFNGFKKSNVFYTNTLI